MTHEEAGRYWNGNADAWTKLARAGYDVYRVYLNTPAFLAMLPNVAGLAGLDVGCRQGHNTRLLARRGARMPAIDVAENFVARASQTGRGGRRGIDCRVARPVGLPFADGASDCARGVVCFMVGPETDRVLAEACRALTPGAFLRFSTTHPRFDTPRRRNLRAGG